MGCEPSEWATEERGDIIIISAFECQLRGLLFAITKDERPKSTCFVRVKVAHILIRPAVSVRWRRAQMEVLVEVAGQGMFIVSKQKICWTSLKFNFLVSRW